MTRKSNISIIIALVAATSALVVAPAAAAEYPGSVTALSSGYEPGEEQTSEYPGSVTALATGYRPERESSEQVVTPRSDFQPLNGILGDDSVPQPVPTSVADDGGFDWTDAVIGALISSALLATAFLAARSIGRRRGSTAESHA